jgi:uncharacterized protein (TIGR03437 family)
MQTFLRHTTLFVLFAMGLFATAALARPSVGPGGVANIASNAPDGLANSGIAQGSIFVVRGTGLGDDNPNPMNLFQNTTYPLPTILNGTSISIQGPSGARTQAIMLYESATLLAAILPSAAQLGASQVTVTYGGFESIETATIHVVARALGLFTFNQIAGNATLGTGPGMIQNLTSSDAVLNTFTVTAKPGQSVVLYGTGLGAISGNEAQGPAKSGVIGLSPLNVQIQVGNKIGIFDPSADYMGRFVTTSGLSYAGVDIIEFQIPQGVQGCYVPVAVITNGIASNVVTMAIDADGGKCSDPALGYSADDLQQIVNDQTARVGTISLNRLDLHATGPDGSTQTVRSDGANGSFLNMSPQQFHSAPGNPSAGGCTVIPFSGTTPPAVGTFGTPLDAGPVLNVNGPDGSLQLTPSSDLSSYVVNVTAPFLDTGAFSVDNGAGGADVGAFQVSLNAPDTPQWLNATSISTVAKDQPLRITWSGGDPAGLVAVIGASIDPNLKIGALFTCTANASDGQLTVPSYILSWLPTNSLPVGLLFVAAMGQSRFQAPGLEAGYLNYTIGTGKNVQFTPRATGVKE